MLKKLGVLFVTALLIFTLSGCNIFSFEEKDLLSPPKLSDSMQPIEKALEKSVKGKYTLQYAKSGEYRSAVILEDILGDNRFEAIAFYSTTDDEITNMHINLITNQSSDRKNEKWKSVSSISIVAGGLDTVEFCDLNGDGTLEIVVGWEIFGSADRQVGVYSLSDNVLSQLLLQPYTNFKCADLNEDGKQDIFIQNLNTSAPSNIASVYSFGKSAAEQIGTCVMDSTVKTAAEPIVSTLSSGQTAIYIDEVKGAGAVTEVLFFSAGELVNPLLNNKDTLENTVTLRQSALAVTDINGDGTLEIPVAYDLPSALISASEKLYYTSWCSFNGETLASKLNAIHNTLDGYYITVPEKWLGKIAVLKDTENRIRTFYEYDEQTLTVGKPLAQIKVVKEAEFKESDYKKSDFSEIARSNSLIYLGLTLKNDSPLNITAEELKASFSLFSVS